MARSLQVLAGLVACLLDQVFHVLAAGTCQSGDGEGAHCPTQVSENILLQRKIGAGRRELPWKVFGSSHLSQRKMQVTSASQSMLAAGYAACDTAAVSRRRRDATMCACRRRSSAASPQDDDWVCGEDNVVHATTTTTTTICADSASITRRRRNADMCSCRRRQSMASPQNDGWTCGEGNVVVKGPSTSATTTTTTTACAHVASITRRRRNVDMCSCRRRSGRDGSWTCQDDQVVEAPAPTPYLNQYDGSNPLSIQPAVTRSDNYFLILGDWGRAGGPGQCQLAVAAKMKDYVRKQKEQGKTLLAILTTGDNFYWCGVKPEMWQPNWGSVYGTNDSTSPLHGVPWLASLGNHDLGDDDPYAFCPHVQPLATHNGQAYGCQQFNADRNPSRPEGTELYYMPDYNFHYTIPGADVEFIIVDANRDYVNHKIFSIGFNGARDKCGGAEVVSEFLHRVAASGEDLLRRRAREGTARTTVIVQHYPEAAWPTRRIFEEEAQAVRNVSVLSAWGHAHDQQCAGRDANGNCNMVLSGGGGGCCLGNYGGFTAVHLTDDGGFATKIDTADVRIPRSQCRV